MGAPPGAQAQHVERYAAGGDLAAVAILREAGEAALRLAPASAAHWFAAALRLLPEGGPVGQRLELLLARSGSLAAIGRLTEARGDLLAALDLSVREAPSWRVRITTACTGVEHLLGLQREAHRHLASA